MRDVIKGALHPNISFPGEPTARARTTLPHAAGRCAAQICEFDLESRPCRGPGRARRRIEIAGRRAGIVPPGSQPLSTGCRGRQDIGRMSQPAGLTTAWRGAASKCIARWQAAPGCGPWPSPPMLRRRAAAHGLASCEREPGGASQRPQLLRVTRDAPLGLVETRPGPLRRAACHWPFARRRLP